MAFCSGQIGSAIKSYGKSVQKSQKIGSHTKRRSNHLLLLAQAAETGMDSQVCHLETEMFTMRLPGSYCVKTDTAF